MCVLAYINDQPQDSQDSESRMVHATSKPPTPVRNGTSVTLYLINPNTLGSTKWSLLQKILSNLTTSWPLRLTSPNRLYWNNPEGDRYPFDLSKPLPLQGHPCHLTVAADYFFNNDLEYLKSSDSERTYTTSIMKTKATWYEIEGIEDMVPMLWSPTKVGVKSVSVKKLHRYGHLEDIMVKRADLQFYKFKEGDFVDLYLNDIEDMLLLVVQHKLFHLTDRDIVDFIVALRMFTRSLVIKKRVGDLQLGVERLIYKDLTKQKRVMRADELYKFSDGTLKKVQDELHHRIRDFHLEYNKKMLKRKWITIDRKRSELMVELIDKQMRERRIIQNLERLVGARELEMEYKLMTRAT
nr:hypothetical protein [Tanacetum cinerariifolium]